jgi:hypothetical protein
MNVKLYEASKRAKKKRIVKVSKQSSFTILLVDSKELYYNSTIKNKCDSRRKDWRVEYNLLTVLSKSIPQDLPKWVNN